MLFHEIVFGPIKSRRLGVSLGINLLPQYGKICSFDCIYCECGYNASYTDTRLPSRQEVAIALESKLKAMSQNKEHLDVITFAGNGEPTIHPEFPEIIAESIVLRDQYFPQTKISVLSNATRLGDPRIIDTLLKVDDNILKIDSAIQLTAEIIDQPNNPNFSIDQLIEQMKQFKGKLILQTMFLRGIHNGIFIDNTTEHEIQAWLNAVQIIQPQSVMIYTIDRPTPEQSLEKISMPELQTIARHIKAMGIPVSVAG